MFWSAEKPKFLPWLLVSYSTGSSYQDPSSLPCTGPPGTPSPIRDAMYSARDDPSSDVYADVDALRGDPDGKTATLPREDQNMWADKHKA